MLEVDEDRGVDHRNIEATDLLPVQDSTVNNNNNIHILLCCFILGGFERRRQTRRGSSKPALSQVTLALKGLHQDQSLAKPALYSKQPFIPFLTPQDSTVKYQGILYIFDRFLQNIIFLKFRE